MANGILVNLVSFGQTPAHNFFSVHAMNISGSSSVIIWNVFSMMAAGLGTESSIKPLRSEIRLRR